MAYCFDDLPQRLSGYALAFVTSPHERTIEPGEASFDVLVKLRRKSLSFRVNAKLSSPEGVLPRTIVTKVGANRSTCGSILLLM